MAPGARPDPRRPDPGRSDPPAAQAATHARSALLSDPEAVADLLRLADIREACYARPHWPGAVPRYWSAVEASMLRRRYTWSELDHIASLVRTWVARSVRDRIVPASSDAG